MRPAEELLVRSLPRLLARRCDRSAAATLEAVYELRVSGRPLRVQVSGGRLQVRPGPAVAAGARLELSARDLVALALGEAAWPQLLSAGRLRLAGDPFLALRLPPLIGLAAGTRK
jgi:hypothetical protein